MRKATCAASQSGSSAGSPSWPKITADCGEATGSTDWPKRRKGGSGGVAGGAPAGRPAKSSSIASARRAGVMAPAAVTSSPSRWTWRARVSRRAGMAMPARLSAVPPLGRPAGWAG